MDPCEPLGILKKLIEENRPPNELQAALKYHHLPMYKYYMRVFNSLNYSHISGYFSTKKIAETLSRKMLWDWELGYYYDLSLGDSEDRFNQKLTARLINNENLPVYWIDSNLAKSLQNTKLPSHWQELRAFMPRAFLIFPKNLLFDAENEPINWVYFDYCEEENLLDNVGQEQISSLKKSNKDLNITLMNKQLEWISFNYYGFAYQNYLFAKDENDNFVKYRAIFCAEEMSEEDKQFVVRSEKFNYEITELIVKIMLYMMLGKSRIIVDITKQKKKGFCQKFYQKIKQPRWIGKGHQIKKYNSNQSSSPTGLKLATHWRAGHFRQQPIGNKEKPDYKTIWIEPVLINP